MIDLGGAALPMGDGLLFADSRLYVVQKSFNIAVVNLNHDLTSGAIERTITDPDFRVPSTIASFGDSLYVVKRSLRHDAWTPRGLRYRQSAEELTPNAAERPPTQYTYRQE